MPVFNFATYVDTREEWVIHAKDLDEARELVGDQPNGDWTNHAILVDTEAVECRIDFVTDIDTNVPAITEVTPDHWAWNAAHRDYAEHALGQNIAAISGEFHTHHLCGAFYDRFGKYIDGFVGQYDLCIAMAEALTDWEIGNGLGGAYDNAGVPWIELIEDFVETVLVEALHVGEIPDPAKILPTIQVLAGRPS